jgi:formate-dependent phosphoribosylglycinamide formyltransferase (GAR transformylase)
MAAVALAGFLLPAGTVGRAQEKSKPETIQAQAMRQLKMTGKTFNITILIESYSTPEDQRTLIDAFQKGGHDQLVKTIAKMKGRGRVSITGTLGYQIAYVRSIPGQNGRTIRLITDRPIQFQEARNATRSRDYDLSAIELRISEDRKKS